MGSSRLPGKSLLPVWREMPLLELVLRRVMAARRVSEVVLATTTADRDDELVVLAEGIGIAVVRGPEDDVLARMAQALESHPADAVIRVCADNPFVDPRELDRLVEYFQASDLDYATNAAVTSGLPDGAGAEILRADALRRAAAEATDPAEREHVTVFVKRRDTEFRLGAVPPPDVPWPLLKLDIDSVDDYRRIQALAKLLPEDDAPLWPLSRIVAAYPD